MSWKQTEERKRKERNLLFTILYFFLLRERRKKKWMKNRKAHTKKESNQFELLRSQFSKSWLVLLRFLYFFLRAHFSFSSRSKQKSSEHLDSKKEKETISFATCFLELCLISFALSFLLLLRCLLCVRSNEFQVLCCFFFHLILLFLLASRALSLIACLFTFVSSRFDFIHSSSFFVISPTGSFHPFLVPSFSFASHPFPLFFLSLSLCKSATKVLLHWSSSSPPSSRADREVAKEVLGWVFGFCEERDLGHFARVDRFWASSVKEAWNRRASLKPAVRAVSDRPTAVRTSTQEDRAARYRKQQWGDSSCSFLFLFLDCIGRTEHRIAPVFALFMPVWSAFRGRAAVARGSPRVPWLSFFAWHCAVTVWVQTSALSCKLWGETQIMSLAEAEEEDDDEAEPPSSSWSSFSIPSSPSLSSSCISSLDFCCQRLGKSWLPARYSAMEVCHGMAQKNWLSWLPCHEIFLCHDGPNQRIFILLFPWLFHISLHYVPCPSVSAVSDHKEWPHWLRLFLDWPIFADSILSDGLCGRYFSTFHRSSPAPRSGVVDSAPIRESRWKRWW